MKLKIEYLLFYILAFYPTFSIAQILSMGLATCLLECVIGIADTPFLYLARALKHGDESDDRAGVLQDKALAVDAKSSAAS